MPPEENNFSIFFGAAEDGQIVTLSIADFTLMEIQDKTTATVAIPTLLVPRIVAGFMEALGAAMEMQCAREEED